MGYNKTAKDIAWDKEKLKFKSHIMKLEEENSALGWKICQLEDDLACVNESYEQLERAFNEHFEISPEEMKKHIETSKKMNSMMSLLNQFGGTQY